MPRMSLVPCGLSPNVPIGHYCISISLNFRTQSITAFSIPGILGSRECWGRDTPLGGRVNLKVDTKH